MDSQDKEIIDGLGEPAKRLFYSLDKNSQQRMLKQAEQLAKQRLRKEKQKRRLKRKIVPQKENKKGDKKSSISRKRNTAFRHSTMRTESKRIMTSSLQLLLLSQVGKGEEASETDSGEQDISQNMRQPFQLTKRAMGTTQNHIRSHLQRIHLKKKMQKEAARKAEKGAKSAVKGAQKAASGVAKTITSMVQAIASNPVVWIAALIVLIIGILVGVIAMIIGSGGASNNVDNSTYQAQVSERAEGYRELVEQYCEKYEIDDYVDLCLAVIEQESAGNPPDVMQTAQSYYNTKPSIDTPEESIDCGTHELSDCLTKASCKSSMDIPGISLALQGYNFGNGYIDWAKRNYKGYTKDNAEIFAMKMCDELEYESYGDSEYVPHVLRYYIANPETSVTNESAKSILEEIKDHNDASDNIWRVIEKGASLIGKVKYSMEKRESDGRDNPVYLDCSAFTAWAFHKAGNTGVPYSSNTGTFISSTKFVDVAAKDLQPGDIGLKNKTAGTGGANHVGIYCGTLKNGTKVWMHCTSSSSSSLTGNDGGPMFGAYTNFTYFRRLKKWNK